MKDTTHEWGKDREMFTTNGTYPWSFVTQIFHSGQPSHGGNRIIFVGLNHTSESSVRAKYTIYLPSFLAAIHYYVGFPLVDILFITKEPLLIPKVSRNAYIHIRLLKMRFARFSSFTTVNIKWYFGHIFYEYLFFSTF
jgi:hypothetical protein